jgi:hypothetical protein
MPMSHRGSFCGRTRREFLWQAGSGFAGLALADLLARDGWRRGGDDPVAGPLAQKPPHHPAKAKACIFLFMYGGPSQVDTFDHKPKLYGLDGKTIDIATKGRGGTKSQGRVVGPKWRFRPYGASAVGRSATCSRTWPSASTTWRSCTACTPTRRCTARRC